MSTFFLIFGLIFVVARVIVISGWVDCDKNAIVIINLDKYNIKIKEGKIYLIDK